MSNGPPINGNPSGSTGAASSAPIGPTFGQEVIAAGLGGLPFGWVPATGEIFGRDKLTPAQNATLDGVIAAHNPNKALASNDVTSRQFYQAYALQGYISRSEALNIVKRGAIPQSIQNYINTLSADDDFHFEMLMCAQARISRTSPYFLNYATWAGLTQAQIESLFTLAATL